MLKEKTKQKHPVLRTTGFALCALLVVDILIGVLHPLLGRVSQPEDAVLVKSQPDTEQLLCIDDNTDALLWRLRVIESALERIAMSTFELGVDESSLDLMAALKAAADPL